MNMEKKRLGLGFVMILGVVEKLEEVVSGGRVKGDERLIAQ